MGYCWGGLDCDCKIRCVVVVCKVGRIRCVCVWNIIGHKVVCVYYMTIKSRGKSMVSKAKVIWGYRQVYPPFK